MKFMSPVALVGLKRTYIGKLGGLLARIAPHDLLASCFRTTLLGAQSAGMDSAQLSDVVVGCVRNSIGNIARIAALTAGIPDSVPARTVDRQCASGMEAVVSATLQVQSDRDAVLLCGGVESASRAPWLYERATRAYAMPAPKPFTVLLAPEFTGNLSMPERRSFNRASIFNGSSWCRSRIAAVCCARENSEA